MGILEILASLATVLSLAFAVYVYHREQVRKIKEEGNYAVLRERLRNIELGLRGAATNLQLLIRQADNQETPVRELQNMARGVRSPLLSAIMQAHDLTSALEEWTFGQLLRSAYQNKDADATVDGNENAS